MPADAGGHLMGDPDDLRRMLEAFEERNDLAARHEKTMARLVERVTSLALEVSILRLDLNRRPTKYDVEHKRRRAIFAAVLMAVSLAFIIDIHTESCGPGARAERSLDSLSNGERDPQRIVDAGRPRESAYCDISVPLHGHSGQPFPNEFTELGWALYGVGFVLLVIYVRGPRPPAEPDHDRRKEDRDSVEPEEDPEPNSDPESPDEALPSAHAGT